MNVEEAKKVVFTTCCALHRGTPYGMEGDSVRPWAGKHLQAALAQEPLLGEALRALQAEYGIGRTMEWTVAVVVSGGNTKDILAFLSDEELYKLLLNRIGQRALQSIQFPPEVLIPNNVQKDAFALGFALGGVLSNGDSAVIVEATKKLGPEPVAEWGRQLMGTMNLIVQFQLVTVDTTKAMQG